VEGDLDCIKAIEYIDQNPIGRSSRSNPATYLKIFDDIRDLMAAEPLSKLRGYSSGYFSFNVPGGRCETCQGEGEVVIDMQFMADVHMCCESCNGTRFKAETLEVTYHSKNITALLNLTVNEAQDFFKSTGTSRLHKRIFEKLKALQDVGMGYVQYTQRWRGSAHKTC
jgi:excinuclease ABC subunit A